MLYGLQYCLESLDYCFVVLSQIPYLFRFEKALPRHPYGYISPVSVLRESYPGWTQLFKIPLHYITLLEHHKVVGAGMKISP